MPEDISTTVETTPTSTKEKSFDWVKVILTSIIGFVLLAVSAYGGYWYGTQSTKLKVQNEKPQPKTQIPETPTPTPEPATIRVVDPTTNWKTFKNAKYSYEFKYPPTWSVLGEEDNLMVYDKKVGTSTVPDFVITIYVADLAKGVSLDDPIGKRVETADKVFEEKLADVILGGKQAVKAKVEVLPGSQTDVSPGLIVKLQLGQKTLYLRLYYHSQQLSSSELNEIFNQILSTFKFLD